MRCGERHPVSLYQHRTPQGGIKQSEAHVLRTP